MYNQSEVKKILLIKPRGIGDVILSTIALKNLKNYYPKAELHYLTEEFAAPVLFNNPFIDKIISFGKNNFASFFQLARNLRKEKYDIVFDFYSNPRTAQITFLTQSPVRVGYDKTGRKYAYTIKIKLEDPNLHSAKAHLEFLKKLKIPIVSEEIHYFITEQEKAEAQKFFNNFNGKFVGIIPGGGWESKRCEPEKFAEISKEIFKRLNYKTLILWGESDKEDAQKIFHLTENFSVLAPPTSIREMVALIDGCVGIISNDSGPMHLAAAINKPTLGLFGPTNPFAHGPFNSRGGWVRNDKLDCIPCNLLVCNRNHECMLNLDTNLVVYKFEELIKK